MWAYVLDVRSCKYARILPTVVICSANRRFHLVRRFQAKFVCGNTQEAKGDTVPISYGTKTAASYFSEYLDKRNKSACRNGLTNSVKADVGILHQTLQRQGMRESTISLPTVYVRHTKELCLYQGNSQSFVSELPIVFQATNQNTADLKNATQKLKDIVQYVLVQDMVDAVGRLRNDCTDDIIIRHHHHRNCYHVDHNVISRQKYPVTFIESKYFVKPQNNDTSTEHALWTTTLDRDNSCVLSMDGTKLQSQEMPEDNNNNLSRPSKEQLEIMYHKLCDEIPKFYMKPHDFTIYHDDVEFNNQILGLKTRGKTTYQAMVNSLKMTSLLYFIDAELEVLKVTVHPDESSIQARWRIKALPFHIWLLRLHKRDKTRYYRYYDAFSTFYVGTDGLVHVHKVDKMMPDRGDKEIVPSWFTRLRWALGGARPPAYVPQ